MVLETDVKNSLRRSMARGEGDIAAAQALRYRVFYEERGRLSDAALGDADPFDAICDHLLIHSENELVGTYRLLRQDVAQAHGGFYTQREFDIAPLLLRHPALRFLELGRSCVAKTHRDKPVMELLWQGIWDYVRHHKMDVMLGCASLEGTDLAAHGATLSFLHQHAQADAAWTARAHDLNHVALDRVVHHHVNARQAMRDLPPLIKGYLRLGCMIGEGASIDHDFNTTDVLIILPVSRINPRYFTHFGAPA
jgi:L-ornithine Nalpha-acyltransferase